MDITEIPLKAFLRQFVETADHARKRSNTIVLTAETLHEVCSRSLAEIQRLEKLEHCVNCADTLPCPCECHRELLVIPNEPHPLKV
jgi:hypothetical protein